MIYVLIVIAVILFFILMALRALVKNYVQWANWDITNRAQIMRDRNRS